MKTARAEYAKALKQALDENEYLVKKLQAENWPLAEFQFLQDLQQRRMARDYKDFLEQPDFAPAIEFFLTELYGGLGFIERNNDLKKVYSIMTRMLPDSMLQTLAEAMQFQALSIKLDMEVRQQLVSSGVDLGKLNLAQYAAANVQLDAEASRRLQVESVVHLGKALQKEVRRPFALQLLKLMRLPAKAAGFGQLHDFLERGLSAFLRMPDISTFLLALQQRETKFIDGVFNQTG